MTTSTDVKQWVCTAATDHGQEGSLFRVRWGLDVARDDVVLAILGAHQRHQLRAYKRGESAPSHEPVNRQKQGIPICPQAPARNKRIANAHESTKTTCGATAPVTKTRGLSVLLAIPREAVLVAAALRTTALTRNARELVRRSMNDGGLVCVRCTVRTDRGPPAEQNSADLHVLLRIERHAGNEFDTTAAENGKFCIRTAWPLWTPPRPVQS